MLGDNRLSLKPENLECSLFLYYNISSLALNSREIYRGQPVTYGLIEHNGSDEHQLPEAITDTVDDNH